MEDRPAQDVPDQDDVGFNPEAVQRALASMQAERQAMAAELRALRLELERRDASSGSSASPSVAVADAPSPVLLSSPPEISPPRTELSLDSLLSRAVTTHLLPAPFSGTGKDSPVDFLRSIEHLVCVRHLDFSGLSLLMSSLLMGPAAAWFRSARPHLTSTTAILEGFRAEYVSATMELSLLAQIRSARQGPAETTVDFVDRVCSLYASLPSDRPPSEVIQHIILSARPQVALYLGTQHTSVGALRAEARRLDTLLPPPNKPRKDNNGQQTAPPTDSRQCFKCGIVGHIRRHCPNPPKNGPAASPQGRDVPDQQF